MHNGISILISYYNGSKHFECQLKSILLQLKKNDEIIIRDDGSDVLENIDDLISNMPDAFTFLSNQQIRVIKGKNIGVNKSFELLLTEARRPFSVFCDQDDIWKPGRLQSCRENMASDLHCVNFEVNGFLQLKSDYKLSAFKIFFRNKFPGCCMSGRTTYLKGAFSRIPNSLMYDHALLYITLKKRQLVTFDPISRVIYRRHSDTVTKYQSLIPNGLFTAIRLRIKLLLLRS